MKRGRGGRRKRALPLSFRVAAIYALLVTATLVVVAGLAIQFTRSQVTGGDDKALFAVVQSFNSVVPKQLNADLAAGQDQATAFPEEARKWLSDQALPEGEGAAVLISASQTLLSQGLDIKDSLPAATLRQLLTSDHDTWFSVKGNHGTVRVYRELVSQAGTPVATVLVSASESQIITHNLGPLLKDIGLASLIGLVFATLLGLIAVRRTLRPLARMSRDVESISETDDLSKRVSGAGPLDEVGRLAEAFDGMLGRLQVAFQGQRRFLSDASHELRTPMTVVRGQLELLAMDVGTVAGRRSMSIAVEELDRMSRIVEDLLLLARLDEGMPLGRDVVEVELVVGEALLRGMLTSPGQVAVDVPSELCVLADPDRLLQVLTNLVTNAVRHGQGAAIGIRARQGGDLVRIEVADQGPGIAPDELPHVFERLFRGSKARSDSPGGAGLGLAIAASLVEAMNGTIEAASTLGVGTTFSVILPAATQRASWAGQADGYPGAPPTNGHTAPPGVPAGARVGAHTGGKGGSGHRV